GSNDTDVNLFHDDSPGFSRSANPPYVTSNAKVWERLTNFAKWLARAPVAPGERSRLAGEQSYPAGSPAWPRESLGCEPRGHGRARCGPGVSGALDRGPARATRWRGRLDSPTRRGSRR